MNPFNRDGDLIGIRFFHPGILGIGAVLGLEKDHQADGNIYQGDDLAKYDEFLFHGAIDYMDKAKEGYR